MSSRPSASHASPAEWDGEVYHRISDPQYEWATEVVDRAALHGDEVVLDAGCGSGRVTKLLVERVPDGRVIGVDGSESMIAKAREVLGPDVDLRVLSLTDIDLDQEVDVVFSNAVFHWIPDLDLLFSRLHRALKFGGRLVAQCGGQGNVAPLVQAIDEVSAEPRYAAHLADMERPWNFIAPEDAEPSLHAAGFEDVRCWLVDKRIAPDQPLEFLTTATLGSHLARLPDEDTRPFAEAVAAKLPSPLTLDYVRLNIDARRPAA